ncbi:phage terminase small subunit P27 family [Peptostreptococcus canis]|uniref:Phage terminase small subunit P27 family n=1 Tax=Peptostreptococcus canis TaxID=1159213 RepID=A0ABR6TMD4_9FIRM|nr:phage terminase small subunit P27 family [Peptostreptococcus canis]MBC2576568.1 phage terminase small subunit P27 family [Peptostreptococcus canis]MBP1998755.1 P27 family predicted phage terminase small subunit [Peptostreptococcus canis]
MAKTGRPPKLSVVSTGKIGKEKKLQREIAESKLKVKRNLKAPNWLSKEAKKEFKRVVEESEPLKLIDNMDLSILSIYCDAYATYIEVTKKINEYGFSDVNDEGEIFIKDETKDLVKIKKMQVDTIMQCSSKLGLATSDRLRLVIPKSEESATNPFLKYL